MNDALGMRQNMKTNKMFWMVTIGKRRSHEGKTTQKIAYADEGRTTVRWSQKHQSIRPLIFPFIHWNGKCEPAVFQLAARQAIFWLITARGCHRRHYRAGETN